MSDEEILLGFFPQMVGRSVEGLSLAGGIVEGWESRQIIVRNTDFSSTTISSFKDVNSIFIDNDFSSSNIFFDIRGANFIENSFDDANIEFDIDNIIKFTETSFQNTNLSFASSLHSRPRISIEMSDMTGSIFYIIDVRDVPSLEVANISGANFCTPYCTSEVLLHDFSLAFADPENPPIFGPISPFDPHVLDWSGDSPELEPSDVNWVRCDNADTLLDEGVNITHTGRTFFRDMLDVQLQFVEAEYSISNENGNCSINVQISERQLDGPSRRDGRR